ncbi:GNAT family N-acetyltransferase [Microlunatus soli]|uniref:N-acetylglutamate synthase, GNAT family n=1 Tax=Microlunatus soli TaxID=630515 RepID=A0A1H1S8Q9_9ACTN|nr:GNAT family N-acetyltransferase [Microlunatus soli]SDS44510.1 N-acetylglutamate synthase, GNAT family [Microlunatus soli]
MQNDPAALLRAYDEQLRTDAETPSAIAVERLGPLRLVNFGSGRGFITYADLGGADAATIRGWVEQAVRHFDEQPEINRVEWKTRGHDHAPGLHEALIDNGFVAEEPESIMIGPAAALAADVPLPDGVTLRRITEEHDVRAMSALADHIFGDPVSKHRADSILRRLARDDGMELWVAEADGAMISSGRLEPIAGTDFAGLWGGSTLAEWRGKGIYRALTAVRARSALDKGKTLLHSDSTEYSRPILERSGLIKVSSTTPYQWTRP